MLYIRADANQVVATGHIMRCCAIAQAAEHLGENVCFLTADYFGKEIVEEKGYSCIVLHSDWKDMDKEVKSMCALIEQYQMKCLLIDSYYVTEYYLKELKKRTRIIYLDDLQKFLYPCDMLINYAVYAYSYCYEREYCDIKLLIGCRYVPLRKEFTNLPPKKIEEEVRNILILTGGSDPFHFALDFIKKLIEDRLYENICFTIICGRYNTDYKLLEQIAEQNTNIYIHKNVASLEKYMQQADIAISAGGTTLYELCACGTPTICYSMADNQKGNVIGFSDLGVMQYCGDIRKRGYMERLLFCIDKWKNNAQKRKEISEQMQRVVDGNGAERIVREMMKW